jgi:hypothetical protein
VSDVNGVIQQVLQIRLDWAAVETAQPVHANQVIAQVGPQGSDGQPDGLYISFGSAPPPVFTDEETQRRATIDRLREGGVKVNVLTQVHITRQLLGDLIGLLQTTAEKYDEVAKIGQVEP